MRPDRRGQSLADWLDTDAVSAAYRKRCIRVEDRKVLISNFAGTLQAEDLTRAPNCDGFGRVRHFRRAIDSRWPRNPLPIDPAVKALGRDPCDLLTAQVFQNAACNWRCWYCFVPFNMLDASEERAAWITADELVDLYLSETDRPPMLDLTGGQPELIPEWVLWTMEALRQRNLEEKVFLWSDDNLSVDYFWTVLSEEARETVATFKGYGRVGCFKGFDERSFSFNTKAAPALFERQFELMRRYLAAGIDMYAYATFTTLARDGIDDAMKRFVDRLQAVHPNLPLRTVPLKVDAFSVVKKRLGQVNDQYRAIEYQLRAVDAWRDEIGRRFSTSERDRPITDVAIK